MLGYVHAGIGDANNIFHGKPVYGKASHAKAAGNVLFLKHGISRYPQAQALGQYLRLFDSGFRHQDNEFVPAVASHYIRLPALLLKEPATRASTRSPSRCPFVSLTSLNLSRSISTTENGRPERDARFHSEFRASQKKRRVFMPVSPSVIDCCCSC